VEVLNLPIAIREDELKRYFLQFGKVTTITQELLNRKAIIGFSSLDG
jgi:RNA recognition motif-containing protein